MPLDTLNMTDRRFADLDQEAAFQQWYSAHAARLGMPPSPDAPGTGYDFRHAYLEGYEPDDNGTWDYRAADSFARTAGTRNVDRTPYRAGQPAAPTTLTRADTPAATVELSAAQRKDALARLDAIQSKLSDYTGAIDAYTHGYVSPDEAAGYRELSKSTDEYAHSVAAHGRDFVRGLAQGEQATKAMLDSGFIGGMQREFKQGLIDTVLGGARLATIIPGAGAPYTGLGLDVKAIKTKIDTTYFGLPANPIERAGYDAAFPWVGKLIGNIGSFAAVTLATGALGEAAGVPRVLQAARGVRGLAVLNTLGAIGGGLVAAGLAPDDVDARKVVEGAAVGLGATSLVSSFLAGRPISTPARLLKIQTMAETLGAEGLGGALRVAPRLTFGKMAQAGIAGAGFATLTAMGQGKPVDKAIGEGVEQGLSFAGYDVAFLGPGRMAQWLPIHARIAETWAKTAESMKIPARASTMLGTMANTGLQGAPGAILGGLLAGIPGAIGGAALTAKKALELQTELATTAARLRSTGTLSDEIVGKLLTGNWGAMSGAEAESVTKALTKDVVERATSDVPSPLAYAIRESMGTAAILDDTEFKAITYERARVTQEIAQLHAQGVLEIDPAIVQRSRRLAELSERRSQILLEEANAHPVGAAGAVGEKVADAQMREIIESANSNKGLVLAGDVEAGAAGDRLIASVRAAQGETGRLVRGAPEPPTRVVFATNSTLLRDLADAHMERAGIDAQISPEGTRVLDAMLAPPRQLTGRTVAAAGTKEAGRIGGPALRALAGGAVGAAGGAASDREHPWRGALEGAVAGATIIGAGEHLLALSAGMKRDLAEFGDNLVKVRNNLDEDIAKIRNLPPAKPGAREFYLPAELEGRSGRTWPEQRALIEDTVAEWDRQGISHEEAFDAIERMKIKGRITGAQESGFIREIGKVLHSQRLEQVATSAEADAFAREMDHAYRRQLGDNSARGIYTETPGGGAQDVGPHSAEADEIARAHEEEARRKAERGFSDETGAARLGILGPLSGGAIGSILAPAIAQHLGMLNEEDSVLTTSAIGFMVGAGLGYKMLARDGAVLDAGAQRVARFVQPTIEGAIAPAEATRVIGKTGNEFRTTIGGKQISGRRLYWAMPQDAQVAHTIRNMDAWPQRTTMRKGGKTITMDMAERRSQYERDLKRFAPFTVTDNDWQRITDSFMNSTKSLGYSPAQQMRLYKGWLGWMTTPLEARARTDISRMSLDLLGRDTHNPFSTAAGIDELRARAVTADTITGPSQPLPRNYRRATNSLNKQGTPTAGRIRELVDDIESNPPSNLEGTAETIQPWWSAPGLRGIAPTQRFYAYADRLMQSKDAAGQLVHSVTQGIFTATEQARVTDDLDRARLASIFAGVTTPDEMALVRRAVEDPAARDAIKGTNPRVHEAALGVRAFLKDKADALGLPEMARIEDYLPWVYNFRTKRELAELARKGLIPSDINYPLDAPVPRHVFFNHLESRTGDAPLGELMSPYESLLMYSHGSNRKIYLDQLLANYGPETFRTIRATQPWIAHDLGRWMLDVVGVPGPGTQWVQKKVESAGLWLEQFPMFQRPGLAQEINDRYFLSPGGANNLSRLATGYAYTSKIAWNTLSMMTNMSQQIINGGTEYGLLNVLTSSVIGGAVAAGERPVLAPILDATVPRAAEYRKLLTERGILSETSQRHFDTLALYEAQFGSNRAHLALTGSVAGAAAGAAGAALINIDRPADERLSVAGGALAGATIATVGAAKSAIMRRALMRVRDVGTFGFNLVETWNRATVGTASIRQASAVERAATSPAYAARLRTGEIIEGIFTGALGGGALGNLTSGSGGIVPGAILGATAAAGAAPFGQSRAARTARSLETIRASTPIFESRIVREQAKDALRPLTDDEVNTLYAQMQTDITQFRIAKEGRGYFLNTPHGQMLGALQSYTLNQAEFVGSRLGSFIESANRAIRGEPAKIDFRVFRFASYLLGVGSVYGALLGGSRDGESDPDVWVSRLGFGVMPLLLWNDASHKWEIKDPASLFTGPLIGDIARTANSYLKLIQDPDANASFADTSDKLTESLFPGAKHIRTAADGADGAATLRMMGEGAMEGMGAGGPGRQPRRPQP